MYTGPKKIFITGAAGYVGAMLADQFSKSPDIEEIIALDKDPMPDLLADNKKIFWITENLTSNSWMRLVSQKRPDVVIHCAWQIRDIFGEEDTQKKWNIGGSSKLFEFVFREPYIKRIIHFSTVSTYGAFEENTITKKFRETDRLGEDEYRYGVEKREVERILERMYLKSERNAEVFVIRPGSITGPRARYTVKKKGLLYYLEHVMPFFPVANDEWCRQYIHEDDITNIVGMFAFSPLRIKPSFRVYNLAPADVVLAEDMARIFNKKIVKISPDTVRVIFRLAWNLTLGRIPTSPGGWKFFCYPIVADGTKITKEFGYRYLYSALEALTKDEGRYMPELTEEPTKQETV
ncbi:MAG: NAD-dependent epimerase/dehydratase family protein [Candidatus Paceibacterota bacterium]|jgi:nucleoside-diphosphate-sugar epimerase